MRRGDTSQFLKPKFRRILEDLSIICVVLIGVFGVLFSQGTNSIHFFISLAADAQAMASQFGASDAGSYLSAALSLVSNGGVDQAHAWVINLWPPGMLTLDALILRIAGTANFGVVLALFIGSVVSFTLAIAALTARRAFGYIPAIAGVTFLALSTPITIWFLDLGLFYAEALGISALLLCMMALASAQGSEWSLVILLSVLAGVFLAVAAYFRAAFYGLITVLEIVALMQVAALVYWIVRRRIRRGAFDSAVLRSRQFASLCSVALTLAVSASLTIPWINFVEASVRGTRDWSVVGDQFFAGTWVKAEGLPEFLSSGGVGWACRIERARCDEIEKLEIASGAPYTGHGAFTSDQFKSEALAVIRERPLDYMKDRAYFIASGWSSSESGNVNQSRAILQGVIFLLGFIFVNVIAFVLTFRGRIWALFWPLASLYILAPLMIGHVEVRYLIPLKLLVLTSPFLWVALKRSSGQANSGLTSQNVESVSSSETTLQSMGDSDRSI